MDTPTPGLDAEHPTAAPGPGQPRRPAHAGGPAEVDREGPNSRVAPRSTGDSGETGAPVGEHLLGPRIEEGLARLDDTELAEHPEAYEAMDAAIRAELHALERLTGDADG